MYVESSAGVLGAVPDAARAAAREAGRRGAGLGRRAERAGGGAAPRLGLAGRHAGTSAELSGAGSFYRSPTTN